jgi:transposase
VDYQSRPGICPKKNRRDRLIRLASTRPDWALGFEDEVWWSRVAQPQVHTWTEPGAPLRLQELTRPKDDTDPKALASYGVLLRQPGRPRRKERMLLRFVDGRPVSAVTIEFLAWACQRLGRQGVKVWLLIWDNASWHNSQAVRDWIRKHNQQVKRTGKGVRILVCALPSKSPWLNPIEPKWMHGKRAIVEPARLLTGRELAERVCARFDCPYLPHLKAPEKVS